MAQVLSAAQLPERIVCVLGMHRSGTSCLTGSLQDAGLFLDEIHTWNPHNLKGNRENQKFVDLHDTILAANGGAWDAPPARVKWSPEHADQALRLLSEHSGKPLFGFKDPRTLLVLKGWRALVPSMEFVGIYRHPNAVARSLQKRSDMPHEEALRLWYAYNKALVQQYRVKPFPLVCFDDPEPILDENIARAVAALRLQPDAAAEDLSQEKFYSAELRSSGDLNAQPLPWKVRRLYKKLQRIGL